MNNNAILFLALALSLSNNAQANSVPQAVKKTLICAVSESLRSGYVSEGEDGYPGDVGTAVQSHEFKASFVLNSGIRGAYRFTFPTTLTPGNSALTVLDRSVYGTYVLVGLENRNNLGDLVVSSVLADTDPSGANMMTQKAVVVQREQNSLTYRAVIDCDIQL